MLGADQQRWLPGHVRWEWPGTLGSVRGVAFVAAPADIIIIAIAPRLVLER